MAVVHSIQLKKPIRYEKRCYSDMRSKAYMSQINLQHGKKQLTRENRKTKELKTDMLRSIGKQSGESVESVLKKKRKATVERICRK